MFTGFSQKTIDYMWNIRLNNKKSFSLIHLGEIEDELLTREFADRLVSGYTFLMPFYDYFVAAENKGAKTT